MDGWIKLHRKIIQNPIYSNSKLVHLLIELLFRASIENKTIYMGTQKIQLNKGQAIFGYKELADKLNCSPGTIHTYMKILQDEKIIENESTNKGSLVTILNWDKYQVTENGLNAEKKQTESNKKDKNEKNNLSKDKLVKTQIGSERNEYVELVLALYEKHTQTQPTDKAPRRVAWNLLQRTRTLMREIQPHFPSDRSGDLNETVIMTKAFDWYFSQLPENVTVTHLETVKLAIVNRFYVVTKKKYVKSLEPLS